MQVKKYKVELLEGLLGTIPKDKNIFKTYIESLKPENKDSESQSIETVEEKSWTGFHKDEERGLFLMDYLFKGFLKHAGNVLKEEVGVKQLKSKLSDFVFVFPRRIFLNKMQADGVFERPLRAMTPLGERVCLARSDYVSKGTTFQVTIGILKHKEISWILIDRLMDYGNLMGLGQFRNGSFGRFSVDKSSPVEDIADPTTLMQG